MCSMSINTRHSTHLQQAINVIVLLIILHLLISCHLSEGFSSSAGSASRRPSKRPNDGSSRKTKGGGGGFGGFAGTSTSRNTTAKSKRRNGRKRRPSVSLPPPPKTFQVDSSPNIQALLKWLDEVEEVEGLEGTTIGSSFASLSSTEAAAVGSESTVRLRGVFAKQRYQPGEYIVAVPFVSTLLIDEQIIEKSPFANDDDNDNNSNSNSSKDLEDFSSGSILRPYNGLQFLTKFLHDPNQRSKFEPYLQSIPQSIEDPNFTMTPDFWPKKEILKLEDPHVVNTVTTLQDDLRRILRNYQEHQHQQQSQPEDLQPEHQATLVTDNRQAGDDNEKITTSSHGSHHDDDQEEEKKKNLIVDFQTLQFAAWIVRTRAFTTYKRIVDDSNKNDGTERLLARVVLIPFLDLLNHAPTNDSISNDGIRNASGTSNESSSSSATLVANAELQVVETKAYDESFYALVAKRHIQPNEEIRITYGTGKESYISMFLKYGFWPEWDSNQQKRDKMYSEHRLQTADNEDDDNDKNQFAFSTSLEEDTDHLKTLQTVDHEDEVQYDTVDGNDDVSSSSRQIWKDILEFRIRMKTALFQNK